MTKCEKFISDAMNGDGSIRVWTIQSPSWWHTLRKHGEIRGDGRRANVYYRPAYKWMMGQMRCRIPAYSGGFPVWFWFSPKPDLRRGAHRERGEHALRIELELPREIVLLSDFQTWHCVLNRFHLSLTRRESREWDRKVHGHDQFAPELPAPLETEIQATWERIFDLDLVNRTKLWGPVKRIQGVVDRVLLSQVRGVREFVAR